MSKKIVQLYLRGDTDEIAGSLNRQLNVDVYESPVPEEFRYMLYEVQFTVEVDTETWGYEIVDVKST